MKRVTEPQDAVLDEALDWMVRLQSGDFSDQEQQQLDRWRAQSLRHDEVFLQLLASLAPVQESPWRGRPSQPLVQVLERPRTRRRVLGQGLALLAAVGSGHLAWRWLQAGMGWPGELVTGTGERRDFSLADGSLLRLNARSRVLPQLDASQRGLTLHRGELALTVAADARRGEFQLGCSAGQVACAAGRLLLSEEGEGIRLATLDAAAWLQPDGLPRTRIAAQRSVLFAAGRILQQGQLRSDEGAWQSGWLEVRDRSLGWVAEALRPYLPGLLLVDEALAPTRLSGLFPLDDMPRTLAMLEQSLPLRVQAYGALCTVLRAV
ncbi:FecR domain-containing protein [Pseudomonas sp. LRF_L74]|uniref:FecR domain-containing protein n=1 Tax=Pseudomonas sp. LRF_L74 TaxID=3369422 RepID=UPI003F647F65